MVENIEYILLECLKYKIKREEIWREVVKIIYKQNKEENNYESMLRTIPKWFIKEEREEDICLFKELRDFNKMAGILGYIPKELKEVVKTYGRKEKKRGNLN